jgi:enoyl-CoA hydratase/carnithine racemase
MADLTEAVSERVAVLTFNRPERLNALSAEMLVGLIDALRRAPAIRRSARSC